MVQGKSEGVKGTANDLNDHLLNLGNPHQVTKDQVGLGDVNNVPRRITLQVLHAVPQGQNLTRYHTHFGFTTLEADAQYYMPACKITKFSFIVTTNSFFGLPNTTRLSLRKNSIVTSIVVDIPANGTGRYEILDADIDFDEGDLLSIQVVTPNTAGNIIFGPGMVIGE